MRWLLAFVAAGLHAGCSDPEARNSVAGAEQASGAAGASHEGLLVVRATPPGHLASITGTLGWKDGCVVLDNGRIAYALIWPRGTVFDPERRRVVVTHGDGTRSAYALGRTHSLPGGEVSDVDGSSPAFLPPGNPACRGPGWSVSPARQGEGSNMPEHLRGRWGQGG